MAGILRNINCPVIKIGGMSDHIHILNSLSRTITQSKMIGLLKKDSSKWLKTKGNKFKNFHWQNGYGVFSISQSKVNTIKTYIDKQREHHKKKTFKEEFREFLKEYHMEYDERYVWD
jgi:REP element-mobilizing transposase RayT